MHGAWAASKPKHNHGRRESKLQGNKIVHVPDGLAPGKALTLQRWVSRLQLVSTLGSVHYLGNIHLVWR